VALVTCNVQDAKGPIYWDSHQSFIRLPVGLGICVVITADAGVIFV